jgi:diguanylate cyclase (GGDEF)-like protein
MIFEARVQDVLSRLEDEGAREDVAALRHLYNRRKEALEELAFCDALTGVFNRRHFDRCFAEECARSRRYSRPLSLIMVDIDHFKRVNDEYGHQKGDQILHLVGQTLRALVRQTDMVFRYGGEELVILLPETRGADAATVAEHCRTRIAAASTALLPAGISVSLGIAELGSDEADSALLGRADAALYEAKRTGRNRSIMAK